MTPVEKQQIKEKFKRSIKGFAAELQSYVSTEDGQWSVKGFIDAFKNVYTITADTKIVSKVLEIHLFPKILAFAEKNDLKVVLPDCQNHYPDFSFVGKKDDKIKFAVDLKTTYRDTKFKGHVNGFTLGSHGAYFVRRTVTKNIKYPYSDYFGHFCLGTIYDRVEPDIKKTAHDKTDEVLVDDMVVYEVKELGSDASRIVSNVAEHASSKTLRSRLKTVERLQSITSVVRNFQFFACEKWELASDHEGSSNTANIGGITWIEDILKGNGVFAKLGEDVFDEYWINYGKLTILKKGKMKP